MLENSYSKINCNKALEPVIVAGSKSLVTNISNNCSLTPIILMWNKYLLIFCLISIFNSPNIFADTTIKTTLTSNYVTNGISQTGDKAALQIGIDYEHDTGLYTGAWTSNVDSGYEMDFNAGYIYKVNDLLGFDIGATHFTYSDNDFEKDSDEYYVGCICLVGILVYAEGEYLGLEYINYDFRTEYKIQKDLAVGMHYGIVELKELNVEYYDYYFSLKKSYKEYDLVLTYWYSEFVDDATTFLSFTRNFDFK